MRKSRAGDVVVDLRRGSKSRAAVTTLRNALTEKISGVVATAVASGVNVDMEVVDLESTSNMEVVKAAVKSTILDAKKEGASVAAAVDEISVTSLWSLKNGHQVAKISVHRTAKPIEISHVRIGSTSCHFRNRCPDATRCFKFHGFAMEPNLGSFTGPNLR